MNIYTTVKETFTYTYGHGGAVRVPAGARTRSASAHGDVDFRWVDPSIFPAGSLERHDAEHYGIRVPFSNINQWEA